MRRVKNEQEVEYVRDFDNMSFREVKRNALGLLDLDRSEASFSEKKDRDIARIDRAAKLIKKTKSKTDVLKIMQSYYKPYESKSEVIGILVEGAGGW